MGIKTVPHPPNSPDLAPCDFRLFPKLRGCRYETIEEMKEAVTKVIDMLTQEDFHEAFQKLLQRYNKSIAAVRDYFEGDYSFMCVLSIKVSMRKKSGNFFNDPRTSKHSDFWELIFIYCGLLVFLLEVFLCCFFFHYLSVKFNLWPSSGDLPRPWIGMLSLVTVSLVITAFHSCCLSHHVFDQANLWPAWVELETDIFWQCSPGTVETQRLYPPRHWPRSPQ